MARGVREIEVKERGVCLRLSVRGTTYDINPSPADVLRVSEQFGYLFDTLKKEGADDKPRDPKPKETAQIADLLLQYLSGPHEKFFRSLPTEMQSVIVNEMWRWYEALDMPAIGADPTPAS